MNVKQRTAQRGRRGRFLDPSSVCESEKKQRLKLEQDKAAETLREEVQISTHTPENTLRYMQKCFLCVFWS